MAASAPSRVELQIGGMTCASCAVRIEKKLNRLQGVEAAVNYATEQASVSYDASRVELEELLSAVEAIGYRASLPNAEAEDADPVRPLRLRLLVAAALSLPLVVVAMAPPLQFGGWGWLAGQRFRPGLQIEPRPSRSGNRPGLLRSRHKVVDMPHLQLHARLPGPVALALTLSLPLADRCNVPAVDLPGVGASAELAEHLLIVREAVEDERGQ